MKRITRRMAGAALGLVLAAGTAGSGLAQDKGGVGVAMPDRTVARWIADGDNMKRQLEGKGYTANLQYADDDIPTQVSQIENMVTTGAEVLVVAAIDGTTLSDILQQAHDAGIKIIAYDRLIRDTPNVDAYATFDNFQVGVIQGTSIEESLGLETNAGPFNIELFGGSPDDNNAFFFYNGAMSVLQPYVDSGKLVIPSSQTGMETVGTLRWDAATAQSRMDNILSAYYSDRQLDAILAPNDVIARGIISSLKGVGYGSGDRAMPVITGQDAEVPSIKSIIAGDQTSTVFKDTRDLARVTVDMVDAMAAGTEVQVNDTTSYDNGVKVVPSYLLKPVLVTKDNYKQILIDSGYYTEAQLQ